MWQRFSELARKVVFYAQEEAQRYGEGYVSTEHLLLGLIRIPECKACLVLNKLGRSPDLIKREVEKQLPRGDGKPISEMTLTPRAKRVIDLAYDEARKLDNNYIGTEHLLLGLIREEDGLAGRVLAKFGVSLDKSREGVLALQSGKEVSSQVPITRMSESAEYTAPLADRTDSALIVVDIQDTFLAPIEDRDRVIRRARFLIEIANLLGIPILVTEQYPDRMGATNAEILEALPPGTARHGKLCFSSCGVESFQEEWERADKSQAVLAGIESHICVMQTAHDFLANDIEVFVCADAISARTEEAHDISMKRLRHAGAVVTHTESVAYEWLQTAGSDEFKPALEIVKRFS